MAGDNAQPTADGAALVETTGITAASAGSLAGTSASIVELLSAEPLSPEVLKALGSNTEKDHEYGLVIHDSLSQLWTPLLKNGLPENYKEKLNMKYLVPENCKFLQAPKLNLEISNVITESVRSYDNNLVTAQQQLGVGLVAINRALDVLLTRNGNHVIEAIKYLSDACRLLSDLHHMKTQARIEHIVPNLDRSFFVVVQDTARDETLFGRNLSEKINSSKTIAKQFLQMKTTTTISTPVPSTSCSTNLRGFQSTGPGPAGNDMWSDRKKLVPPQTPVSQPLKYDRAPP